MFSLRFFVKAVARFESLEFPSLNESQATAWPGCLSFSRLLKWLLIYLFNPFSRTILFSARFYTLVLVLDSCTLFIFCVFFLPFFVCAQILLVVSMAFHLWPASYSYPWAKHQVSKLPCVLFVPEWAIVADVHFTEWRISLNDRDFLICIEKSSLKMEYRFTKEFFLFFFLNSSCKEFSLGLVWHCLPFSLESFFI